MVLALSLLVLEDVGDVLGKCWNVYGGWRIVVALANGIVMQGVWDMNNIGRKDLAIWEGF